MSTHSEHEAVLRRALLQAAESIEPASDGLERIQARLRRPRPLVVAWIEAVWTDVFLRAPAGLQAAGRQLVAALRRAWERIGPTSEPGQGRPLSWLRPLVAMSVAIFVIGVGAYVGLNSSSLLGVGSNAQYSGPGGAGASSHGARGHGKTAGSGTPAATGPNQPVGTATPSGCKKTPKPPTYREPSPSASITPSQTPSGSPSASPSASGTPTSSPTTSTTPNPTTTPAASGDSAGTAATDPPGGATAATGKAGTVSSHESTGISARHRTVPHLKASPTGTPCASKSTATRMPSARVAPEAAGAVPLTGAQLAPARLETATVAAARLGRLAAP
jgi:hypothetical protein